MESGKTLRILAMMIHFSSGVARVTSLGRGKERVWPRKGGAKGCGQDEGSENRCEVWRVATRARGRALQPPVMASVEVLYDIKKTEGLGSEGRVTRKVF